MFRLLGIIVTVLIAVQISETYNTSILLNNMGGCTVASDVELGLIETFKFESFEMNVPKKNELLRTKAYFRGQSPTIIIQNGFLDGVTFGKVNNLTTFGMYDKYSDYTAVRQVPRISKGNVKTFSNNYFTELDIVFTKGMYLNVQM